MPNFVDYGRPVLWPVPTKSVTVQEPTAVYISVQGTVDGRSRHAKQLTENVSDCHVDANNRENHDLATAKHQQHVTACNRVVSQTPFYIASPSHHIDTHRRFSGTQFLLGDCTERVVTVSVADQVLGLALTNQPRLGFDPESCALNRIGIPEIAQMPTVFWYRYRQPNGERRLASS